MSGVFIRRAADYGTSFESYYRETEAACIFQIGDMETSLFHMQKGISGTFQAVPNGEDSEVYYIRSGSIRLLPLDEESKLLGEGDFFAISQREDGILFYIAQDLEMICFSNTRMYLENMYTTKHVDKILSELQEKDGSTRSHGERVRRLVMQMVPHMKHFAGSELEVLLQASRMHDVGKIRIPLSILLKPSPLTEEEYEVMKTHVEHGAEIAKGLFNGHLSEILRSQHEFYDGSGYPDGLKGDEIPVCARIIAVADAYDAMVVTQPYHKGIPSQEALKEIEHCAGSQFDPDCVQALVKAIRNTGFDSESDVILEKTEASVVGQQKEKVKRDFLSNMSHDMRTPMNAIINLTALAKEDAKSEETKDLLMDDLRKIELSSQFLLGLINDILDMARVDSEKIVLHPVVCRNDELTAYIDSVITPLCREKDIHFEWNRLLFHEPIMADKVRFQQIFFNILSNAVKYSGAGGTISLQVENQVVENQKLQVDYIFTDNGIGMSDEFMKRLFIPFEREDTSDSHMGTGLGLSLTKYLVERMGGSIEIESRQGVGTKVMVHMELPVADQIQIEENSLMRKQEKKASQYYDIEGARILLAEDHPMNRAIALRLLEKVGAHVDTAEDGKKALEMFRDSPLYTYDAILMDVRMPIMNGITATQEIRRLDRADAKKVPIIAMTAEAFEQNRQETLAAGMNVHLSKPIQPAELYRTLSVEISTRR